MVRFASFVIDTNFFIGLEEAGAGDRLLPILGDILTNIRAEFVAPSSSPDEVPGRFRALRPKIREYVPLKPVDRSSAIWQKTATAAMTHRLVRVDKDPADIDVIVLAWELRQKLRNADDYVGVVSDDAGVARLSELKDFDHVEHMSCGSFLSVLAAAEKDIERRRALDKTIRDVFRRSWAYKRESRNYIDIKMLVEDLFDTARFVRNAAENSIREVEPAAVVSPEKAAEAAPLEVGSLSSILPLFAQASQARSQNNVIQAERLSRQIIPIASNALSGLSGNLEMEIVGTKMLVANLFEHHTWLLHQRLRQNELEVALSHSYACCTLMNFVSVEKEAIETVFALQALVLLLLGKTSEALETIREVPVFGDMSATQLLGLMAALTATESHEEALELLKKNPDRAEGLLDSFLSYSNDAYNRGRRKLAITLLSFVLIHFADRRDALITEIAERLFMMTRLVPDELREDVIPILKAILREKADDKTDKKLPPLKGRWPFSVPSNDKELEKFAGDWNILELSSDYVLAWNDALQSVWKVILPEDVIEGALLEALSFYLTSGEVEEILTRPQGAEKRYRGVLRLSEPIVRVQMKSPWD